MPYITKVERNRDTISSPQTPGHLNWLFTNAIATYIKIRGLNYQTINDVVGALEGAKMEFYRRIASKYEDNAIRKNGDAY